MTHTTFQDVGFPPKTTVLGLFVCEPARMLVAQFQLQDEPIPRARLYVRGFDEPTYRELVRHPENCDDRDPTPCPVSSTVYFNRLVWSVGGRWDGLYRVRCDTGAVERLLWDETMPTGSVSAIAGISGDGERLFVVVADNRSPTKYGLAALDVKTLAFTELAVLPAVFV